MTRSDKSRRRRQGLKLVNRVKRWLKPPARRRRLLLAGIVAILLVVAYYLIAFLIARQALARLSSTTSAHIQGSLEISASDFLSTYSSSLKLSGAVSRPAASTPAFSLDYDGSFLSRPYAGHSVIEGGKLYFQLTGPDLPVIRYKKSSYLYSITPAWHSYNLDQTLLDNYCENRPGSKYPSAISMYQDLRSVKVVPSPWIGLVTLVDGHLATHYAGTVDHATLAKALGQFNADLPPGCGLENLVPFDLNNATLKYDFWTGYNFDRLRLTLADRSLGIKTVLTLDGSTYGQPVAITPPAGVVDIVALLAPKGQLLARDSTRRADLDRLKSALEAYRAATTRYPTRLADLVPKYLTSLPRDPSSRAIYPYDLGASRDSYTLSTWLEENVGNPYQVAGP